MTSKTSPTSTDEERYLFGGKPPTPVFFWNVNEREHFIVGNQGGSSSSKTFSLLQVMIFRLLENPGLVGDIIGQSLPKLKKGPIRDFKKIWKSSKFFEDAIVNYNKNDQVITLKNGSTLNFVIFIDGENAKGPRRDYLLLNELTAIDIEITKQTIRRTRLQVFADWNADAEFYWHTDYMRRSDTITYYSNFTHNPYCPDNSRNDLLKLKDTNWNDWLVYGLGRTGQPTNKTPAWYGFSQSHISSKEKYDPKTNVHCSFDQNLRPYVSQICAHIRPIANDHFELSIFDEIASKPPKNQIGENCKEFKRRYPRQGSENYVYVYGDASLHVGSTLAKAGVTGFTQIMGEYKSYTKHDSNRTMKANPPISLRTEFINLLLQGKEAGGLRLDIRISPDCENLINDLKYQKQGPDGKPIKERVKGEDEVAYEKYGHMSDSLAYLICSAFGYWWNNFLKNR